MQKTGSEFRARPSAPPPCRCFMKREQINAAEHQPSRPEVGVQSHQLRLKGASAEALMKPTEIRPPSSRRGRPASPHRYLTKDGTHVRGDVGENAGKLLFPRIRVFVEGVWEQMENELMVVGSYLRAASQRI